jgi:hypothetical protein
MNKRLRFTELVKELLACKNRIELADVVKKINEFNKDYFIGETSDEYKKFETILGLMKVKLKHKHGIDESDNITEDEDDDRSEEFFIFANIIETIESEINMSDFENEGDAENFVFELETLSNEVEENEDLSESEKHHLFFMIDDILEQLNK